MAQEGELLERVRALEARLAAVEAVQEIHNLKARYAELVDARYGKDGPRPPEEVARIADQIAELFAEDAVWDGGRQLGFYLLAATGSAHAGPCLRRRPRIRTIPTSRTI